MQLEKTYVEKEIICAGKNNNIKDFSKIFSVILKYLFVFAFEVAIN